MFQKLLKNNFEITMIIYLNREKSQQFDLFTGGSAVFSGDAGGARAPPEFGGSEKGRSLISAYRTSAIITNTPEIKKL